MKWDKEKLPKPNSHVYDENGAEIIVFNMKRSSKKGGGEEKERKRKVSEI